METILLTGANRGLGLALRNVFFEHGYNLVLNCRSDKQHDVFESTPIWDAGPGWQYVVLGDLNDNCTIEELGKVALEKGVDVLVNNAGIRIAAPFSELTQENLRNVIETDLMVPIRLTHAVWPAFKARGGGLIVNINSLAGVAGGLFESAYCAAKHGLSGFGKALQFDGVSDNVRVINVYLGAMQTEMTEHRSDYEKLIDPVDAADAIVRLCKEYRTLRLTDVTIARRLY